MQSRCFACTMSLCGVFYRWNRISTFPCLNIAATLATLLRALGMERRKEHVSFPYLRARQCQEYVEVVWDKYFYVEHFIIKQADKTIWLMCGFIAFSQDLPTYVYVFYPHPTYLTLPTPRSSIRVSDWIWVGDPAAKKTLRPYLN